MLRAKRNVMRTKHWLIHHNSYTDVNLLNTLQHSVISGVQHNTQELHARQQVMNTSVDRIGKFKKYEPSDRPSSRRQPNCMSSITIMASCHFAVMNFKTDKNSQTN